jgi:FKBP-type peptidyl-prolyl cis-trans isomerase FkpA
MHKNSFFALLLLAVVASALSCKKDEFDAEEQLRLDRIAIRAYIAEKGLQCDSTASGLYYLITKPGSGGSPNISSNVTVGYKGYLLDGTVFDQTVSGAPVNFPLSNLIVGWQIGLPLIQKTGRITLLVPSGLAYGQNGGGTIPPNTPIGFDIELVDFF